MAEKRLSGEEQRAKMKEMYKRDLKARKDFLEDVKEHQRQKKLTDAVLNVTGALENDDTDVWVEQLNKESALNEAKAEMAMDGVHTSPEVSEKERLAMSDAEIRKLKAAELVAQMKAEMEGTNKGPATQEPKSEAPKAEVNVQVTAEEPSTEEPISESVDAESGAPMDQDRPNRKMLDGI